MKHTPLFIGISTALVLNSLPLTLMAAEGDEDNVERVEITGSRIKRTDTEGSAPVLTISRNDLEKSGLTAIGEMLQQLTSSGAALNAKFNPSGNFGYSPNGSGIGAGSVQVDLRNLGSNRVLVLVDGRRWVNESSASGVSGAVDLNTIPLAMVDRIEVLEDGASSIYGSDAIAGVVNIITRKEFDGVDFNVYQGQYREGDGSHSKAEITTGGGNEKFHAVFSISYDKQDRVSSGDRSLSRNIVPGHPEFNTAFGSSGTPQGRFIFIPDTPVSIADTCAPVCSVVTDPGFSGVPNFPDDYHKFGASDRFNYAPYNLALTPNQRKSIFTSLNYALNNEINWFTTALFNNRYSTNQAAPDPIFIGADSGGGAFATSVSIPQNHPFNPFGQDLCSTEQAFGPGTCPAVNFFLGTRRPIENGPRIFHQDVDTFYYSTGLDGIWGDYDWSVNYFYSSNKAVQVFPHSMNTQHVKLALGDVDVCEQTPGCVPANIFGGPGTLTPAMLKWITVTTKDASEQTISGFAANFTGPLAELASGPLGFATGIEHRRYAGSFTPDQIRVDGASNDATAFPVSGQYNVNEAYGELSIPITTRIETNVALRYSDYDNFGSESTAKIGAKWKVFDDLLLRASWSQGFRAPVIGELQGFGMYGAPVNDRCNFDNPNMTSALQAKCDALGVTSALQYHQNNTQIGVSVGGNPDLDAEQSTSRSAGLVYSPAAVKGLDVEWTYYRHHIDDAIMAPDSQNTLDRCIDLGPSSPYCAVITRNPITGQIIKWTGFLDNIGEIDTSGYDFRVNFKSALENGSVAINFQLTHVIDYQAVDKFGGVYSRAVGVEENDGAIPRNIANMTISYELSDWTIGLTNRYTSRLVELCGAGGAYLGAGICSDESAGDFGENQIKSMTFTDMQLTWNQPFAVTGMLLKFGLNNVFDKDPPECLSCSLNGYDASTYDLQGQYYYLQLAYKME